MRFEWNEAKNRIKTKHDVSFEIAARIFDDQNYVLREDRADVDREMRWQAVGLVRLRSPVSRARV